MTRFRPFSANFALHTQHLLLGAVVAIYALPAVAEEAAPKTAGTVQLGASGGVAKKDSLTAGSAAKSPTKAATAPAAPAPAAAANAAAPTADAPAAVEPAVAAKTELDAGRTAYTTGDYVAASERFSKALALQESAEGQYWLAMSYDLQGKTSEAYSTFASLVANPKLSELPADQQTQAKQRLDVLAKIPAAIQVNVTPATAALSVDGTAQVGSAPFSLKLAAGKHTLSASSSGFEPKESEIEVKPAESREETLELKAVAAAPAPIAAKPVAPAPAATEKNLVPAYVTLGVAGASAIVGGIFGISALGSKSDYDKTPSASLADDVERNALIADMAFGVALTLGITGVVLLTTDEPSDTAHGSATTQHAELRVAPYVSPRGAGASARLSF